MVRARLQNLLAIEEGLLIGRVRQFGIRGVDLSRNVDMADDPPGWACGSGGTRPVLDRLLRRHLHMRDSRHAAPQKCGRLMIAIDL
jgi:hypothetical protein